MLLTGSRLPNRRLLVLEQFHHHVAPEHSHAIKVLKDLGSAAVFIALSLAFMVWVAALGVRIF